MTRARIGFLLLLILLLLGVFVQLEMARIHRPVAGALNASAEESLKGHWEAARELSARGKAVVLVLHDIALALERADRVAVLREGALVSWDIPEAVFRSGVLQQTFRVGIERMDTPHGIRYYYTEEAE